MNEMGNLADGDLTIKATVTEDITGAIADSVNFTIDELRGLVGRINNAAAQVTTATEAAQTDLGAAARRSRKAVGGDPHDQRIGAEHGEGDERHVGERLAVGERGAAVARGRAERHRRRCRTRSPA